MMRFEQVAAGYGGAATLRGISGAFGQGRITGIVGPNGSGKTTLLKTAMGFLPTLAGTVFVREQPLAEYSVKTFARQVAYLPQTRNVPGITVGSLVAHGRYPHLGFGRVLTARDRAIIQAAMDTAGVRAFRGTPLTALSGGERQRAYVAMMLAQDTPLMLLDEPTTYLDLQSQFDVMDMLCTLRAQGKTIALVLHDLGLAMRYCDVLWVMRGGEVLCQDTPDAVFRQGALTEAFGVRVRCLEGHYVFEKSTQSGV